MQKSKKKIGCLVVALIIIAVLVLLVLYFGFGIPDLGRKEMYSKKYIKNNTGIEIPENAKLAYRYDNKNFFPVPGRLPGYYVFKFDSEPSEWLEENSFSKDHDEEFESKFKEDLPDWILEELSADYIVDFEKPYYWLEDPNLIYFVYAPDKLMLIVFVSSL